MQLQIIDPQQQQERLADITRALRDEDVRIARLTVESMIRQGNLLLEAQQLVPEGQWERFVQEQIGFDIRTVQNYQSVARLTIGDNFWLLVGNLPHVSSWYILASPTTPPSAFEVVTSRALDGEILSHKVVKEIVNAEKRREVEFGAIHATAASIAEHGRGAASYARSLVEATADAAHLGAVEIDGEQFGLSELLVTAAEQKTAERQQGHIEAEYALNFEMTARVKISDMHVDLVPREQGTALGVLMDFRDQDVQIIIRKRRS